MNSIQILSLTGFNLSTINILLIDEPGRGEVSADFLNSGSAIAAWVQAGGIVAIHDRNVCYFSNLCTPVPGSAGIVFNGGLGQTINVEQSGNLVVNGPFGIIDNSSLSNARFYSDFGWVAAASLPAGSTAFLNKGVPGEEVALSYPYGSGLVYYSTIPLDYYLDNPGQSPAFAITYAPNMVAYLVAYLANRPLSIQTSALPAAVGGCPTRSN